MTAQPLTSRPQPGAGPQGDPVISLRGLTKAFQVGGLFSRRTVRALNQELTLDTQQVLLYGGIAAAALLALTFVWDLVAAREPAHEVEEPPEWEPMAGGHTVTPMHGPERPALTGRDAASKTTINESFMKYQYTRIEGSTSVAQPFIPPCRLITSVKPDCSRYWPTCMLRCPERQISTIGLSFADSSSPIRAGIWFMGICLISLRVPLASSWASRTSINTAW